MNRRQLLTCSLSALALPLLARGQSSQSDKLVADSNVIDMLGLLTLNWAQLERWQTSPESFGPADLKKLRDSGINIFHPAVAFETSQAYSVTKDWFEKWNRLINEHPDDFMRVDGPADLPRAKQENKIGIILGMQDANHLRSLDDLDAFYSMGQRLTQLTYNTTNRLGAGCKVAAERGLTTFGREVVARMNKIGMAIDISHCGERTSLEAIEASTKPVLITHSNCRALAPGVSRCKSDKVIVAAARKGGVIGITGVRRFVRASDPVTIEDALNHFDHVVKIVGIEHVGIGSDTDLDGRDSPKATKLLYDIAGLNHTNRVFELTDGLIRRGYTDEQLGLVLGGNFQRALNQIWN